MSAEYIDRPSGIDVLHEQIDYLMNHSRKFGAGERGHRKNCRECARLDKVLRALLVPFVAQKKKRKAFAATVG